MSIRSSEDLAALLHIGSIVARSLKLIAERVKPGVKTRDLDAYAGELLKREGARCAPKVEYGFPGDICISVNDEGVHGIPGERAIREGDVVKLDLTAEKDGYVADAAVTVNVPPVGDQSRRMAECVRSRIRSRHGTGASGCSHQPDGWRDQSGSARGGIHDVDAVDRTRRRQKDARRSHDSEFLRSVFTRTFEGGFGHRGRADHLIGSQPHLHASRRLDHSHRRPAQRGALRAHHHRYLWRTDFCHGGVNRKSGRSGHNEHVKRDIRFLRRTVIDR